jgi:TonB family protein
VRSSNDPLLLALGGTLAFHLVLITAIDILNVTLEVERPEPTPHVELVEIELPPPKPPEPAPPKARVNEEQQQRTETKVVRTRTATTRPQQVTKVQTETKTETPRSDDSGGTKTLQMDEGLLPTGKIPVEKGSNSGGGGSGSGSGTGSGNGSGDAPPPPLPVSVATIKKLAMPKGDHGYIDAGRDYPAAARQRGIEGVIQVKLVVDATGKVRTAVLLNKLGYGLDELALQKAKQIEFEPARDTDDKPVTSVLVWKFNMVLPKK